MHQTKRPLPGLLPKTVPRFSSCLPPRSESDPTLPTMSSGLFGETCFQIHLVKDKAGKPTTNPQSTVCFRGRRCSTCRKQDIGVERIQRHQCGYLDCPSCHEYVNGETHLCFIQRALTPQELQEQKKKRKRKRQGGPRAKRGAAAGLQTTNDMEEEDVYVDDEDMPPLHVFFDIEAMQPHEQHRQSRLGRNRRRPQPRVFPRRTLYPTFSRMAGYLNTE